MSALNRRELFAALARPAVAGVAMAALDPAGARRALAAPAARRGAPGELAADESFWCEVQQAFRVDRSLVNLNNGGVSPSPGVVLDAQRRHVDYSNEAPAYTMWQVLEPQRETVRQRLAGAFGCDPEEVALTRNASEGLETCQMGFDLEAGDEVLTTTQDYPRMLTTWRQLERRRGIVLRQFAIPVPAEDPDEVAALFERQVTAKTRLILMCHMINLTGQILPVRKVVAMARRRGLPVIVDGAHAFAHFPFRHADLDCDYYATSLHKWLFAPHGTGMLFVRREQIGGLWPLMAAPAELDGDVRKFEEIGTHPAAPYLAIAEALTFHEGIGPERKAARLVYLRDRWAKRLAAHPKARLHTSLKPGLACGLATVEIEGVEPQELADHLWKKHRILVTPIVHPEFRGVRVTPSVYTTLEEVDRFAAAMEAVLDGGLPKA
ncbi:MAG TPA: aminotransferase class V-fold PLP-dependent enzyme [Thermoanaerobaculia bacterium]|nr:aminotransferase class V-fold PLP-dependent enzyme [Thermoanaerobaculia bacterium]